MPGRGRRRKTHVIRDASGKSRGERPDDQLAQALAWRSRDLARDGVRTGHPLDPLAGFTLGRLLLRYRADKSDPGGISEAQYDAGEKWAKLVRRHALIMGYPLGTPQTLSFVLVDSGFSCLREADAEEVAAVRRRFADCYRALMDAARVHGLGVRDVTYAVCLENRPVRTLTEADYGHLRVGLNALVKVLA